MNKIFLDSGAFSFYFRKNKPSKKEFKKYVDDYAQFIKDNNHKIEVYANVDVIKNAKETYRIQKYLENKHKLKPIPVFHIDSDFKYFYHYVRNYDYICIGIAKETDQQYVIHFLDKIFSIICDSNGYPTRKIHGFAITSTKLLNRYPWYSVDSSSWVKIGMYGSVFFPRKTYGKYDYKKPPLTLFISNRTIYKDHVGKHIDTISKMEKISFLKYVEDSGFKLGKSKIVLVDSDYKLKSNEKKIKSIGDKIEIEVIEEVGIANDNYQRDLFNAKFYVDLAKSIPEWPWPFKHRKATLL